MKQFLLHSIHRIHARSLYSALRFSQEQFKHPERTQAIKLKQIWEANAKSDYIRAHSPSTGRNRKFSFSTFKSDFPIVTFEDLKPWLDRIKAPNNRVMTQAKTLCWEPTSGSSQAKKWIPYNRQLLNEFNAAINPWLAALYANYKGIQKGSHYWSVSMATRESTPSEIPMGLPDDSHYLSPLARLTTRCIMAVPASVKHETSDEKWKWKTVLYLLKNENLALMSVWSPTFLTTLCEFIAENWSKLYCQLPRWRQRTLRQVSHQDLLCFEMIWPQLALISCWTDGPALPYAKNLRRFFPTVPIQGKGLLTTEGVISVPIQAHPGKADISQGGVTAIGSHFYEFIPEDNNTKTNSTVETLLAHELEIGSRYIPVITTAGGLYRYRINDTVECTGFYSQSPLLKFIGKSEKISDRAGEKLHHSFIQNAVDKSLIKTKLAVDFLLMTAPSKIPGSYIVFLQSQADSTQIGIFRSALESEFFENYHYRQCRAIGQLQALTIKMVNNGWLSYQTTLLNAGLKLGDIKPSVFNDRFNWESIFTQDVAQSSHAKERILGGTP